MFSTARGTLTDLSRGNLGVPLLLLVMLAMMMLPMPPFLLDVFFTFNIALSIVVLLVCVYALRPLDFAVFPTILLVATLLRLALNVASTRVVMLHGQDGHAAGADSRRLRRYANRSHRFSVATGSRHVWRYRYQGIYRAHLTKVGRFLAVAGSTAHMASKVC